MTKLFNLRVALFAALVFAAGATQARAGSIGPTCGSCQGSIYTLTNLGPSPIDLNSTDGHADTWRIVLSIDTSGYTGTGVRIDEVAIKVSSAADTAKLVDAPGGVNMWQWTAGGLSANGCNGSGSGFECADWISGSHGGAFIPGPILTWTFDVDLTGALLIGANAASIKARYVDAHDNKVGSLVSENITLGNVVPPAPVPEPGTLVLMASGAVMALVRRRKSNA